jgi:hypothetical protein
LITGLTILLPVLIDETPEIFFKASPKEAPLNLSNVLVLIKVS